MRPRTVEVPFPSPPSREVAQPRRLTKMSAVGPASALLKWWRRGIKRPFVDGKSLDVRPCGLGAKLGLTRSQSRELQTFPGIVPGFKNQTSGPWVPRRPRGTRVRIFRPAGALVCKWPQTWVEGWRNGSARTRERHRPCARSPPGDWNWLLPEKTCGFNLIGKRLRV